MSPKASLCLHPTVTAGDGRSEPCHKQHDQQTVGISVRPEVAGEKGKEPVTEAFDVIGKMWS